MRRTSLRTAIGLVPPGRWGVAVSGGADSTALLRLLASRAGEKGNLQPVVLHVDHELRGQASRADAAFVVELADCLRLPIHLRRRREIEPVLTDLPANPSARWRRLRLAVYREAVKEHDLAGILLAHHADDQAETVLLRLLRGNPETGPAGLTGMQRDTTVAGVRLFRPLLSVRARRLREWLKHVNQPWREDASNATDVSLRNRLRKLMQDQPGLVEALIDLADACRAAEASLGPLPPPPDELARQDVATLPDPVARRLVREWLIRHGVPQDSAGPSQVNEVLAMLRDPAAPAGVTLPGRIDVRRSKGVLRVRRPGRP